MFLDISSSNHIAGNLWAESKSSSMTANAATEVVLPGFSEDGEDVVISMVESDAQRADASALINRMYAWRGYGDHHELAVRPAQTTFAMSIAGEVIGTLTLTVDSDNGLATDVTFRDELNTYRRAPGAKICELTRFAFNAANPSKRLLAALFHVIFVFGQRKYGCTDLFIEVAQRHRRFYQMMLGFEQVCALKVNDSVGVPSQLMRLKVSDIAAHISAREDDAATGRSRSLYSLFLSKEQESRIYRELAGAIHSRDLMPGSTFPYPEVGNPFTDSFDYGRQFPPLPVGGRALDAKIGGSLAGI